MVDAVSSRAIRPNVLPRVWHSLVGAAVFLALVLQAVIAVRHPARRPRTRLARWPGRPWQGVC